MKLFSNNRSFMDAVRYINVQKESHVKLDQSIEILL